MTRTVPSCADHDVLWLEVAVDDARGVRRREAPAGGEEDVAYLAPARGACRPASPRASAPSTNSIAMKTRSSIVPASWTTTTFGWESRAMALRFAQQRGRGCARRARRRESPVVQQLERDLAIELRVVGGIDLAHATAADQAEDHVAAHGRAARQQTHWLRRRRRQRRLGRRDVRQPRSLREHRGRGRGDQIAARGAGAEMGVDGGDRGATETPFQEGDQRRLVGTGPGRHSATATATVTERWCPCWRAASEKADGGWRRCDWVVRAEGS